jgi:hypothetical protein
LKTSSATEKKAHCEKPKADVKAFMATVIKPITGKASFLATVIHNFPFPYVKVFLVHQFAIWFSRVNTDMNRDASTHKKLTTKITKTITYFFHIIYKKSSLHFYLSMTNYTSSCLIKPIILLKCPILIVNVISLHYESISTSEPNSVLNSYLEAGGKIGLTPVRQIKALARFRT